MGRIPWLLSIACLILVGGACKKYQYGPYLSLSAKNQRVAGDWKIDSAINRFGIDVRDAFSGYRFIFDRNGDATIEFFRPMAATSDTLYGEWSLEEENDIFTWKGLTGDTLEFYYNRDENFDILRLTRRDFWLADRENTFLYLSPSP